MDIAFANPTETGFDFATDGTDIVIGDGLITMLVHCLFRDARAPDGTIDTPNDPRGHWASTLSDNAPDGSLLWLLSREKITPEMPHRVAEILEQACQPLIDDTDGDARNVTRVRAIAQRADHRGRIEAQLNLYLSHADQPRRFTLFYDMNAGRYRLEEIN